MVTKLTGFFQIVLQVPVDWNKETLKRIRYKVTDQMKVYDTIHLTM